MRDRTVVDERTLEVLRSLPDPAEPLKGGVRAGDKWAHLEILEELGYAERRKGWWRKTKGGVLYLREVGR